MALHGTFPLLFRCVWRLLFGGHMKIIILLALFLVSCGTKITEDPILDEQYKMTCSSVQGTVVRCFNDEAICYIYKLGYAGGIHCFKK